MQSNGIRLLFIFPSEHASHRAEFGLPLSRTFVLSDLFLLPNVEFFVLDLKCADQATDVRIANISQNNFDGNIRLGFFRHFQKNVRRDYRKWSRWSDLTTTQRTCNIFRSAFLHKKHNGTCIFFCAYILPVSTLVLTWLSRFLSAKSNNYARVPEKNFQVSITHKLCC